MSKKEQFFSLDPVDKNFPELEIGTLKFWQDNDCFKKSLELRKSGEVFTFYDGPPFATGLPHYGHIVGGTLKDVVPRYKTMRGKYVPRRFGWDCHGLPVEYEMEKELQLSGRKDIEKYGVKNFCESCRGIVQRYTKEWEITVKRMGRWVDFENAYRTMDAEYMESILWVFKSLWDQKLILEDHKAMHICPRCATTLSNFEVSLGYKDIDDHSIVVKFPLIDQDNVFFLAWTTTPWTLPSNLLLAVGAEIEYVKVKYQEGYVILAKNLLTKFSSLLGDDPEIVENYKGADLVGIKYNPLFDGAIDLPGVKFEVVIADFVSTEDGTGIVHIAPAFGDDDLKIGKQYEAPFYQPLGVDGIFNNEAPEFLRDQDARSSNKIIINHLKSQNLVFETKSYRHSYPHCWRCDTPLLNFATGSYFINVTKIKDDLLQSNAEIHWVPGHIKDGRFGKWLEGVRDWAISRNRFWGAPIPVWKCDHCNNLEVVGSIKEISERAIKKGKIFVVRHGEGDHNKQGYVSSSIDAAVHLTPKGIEQVKTVSEQLKNEKIDLVFVSPLIRAKETAEILLQSLDKKLDLIFDNRLKEIDVGLMEGKTIEEWRAQFKDDKDHFYKNPHQGESLYQVEQRVMNFLYEIHKKHYEKNILIVTHSDVIKTMVKFFLNLTPEQVSEVKRKNASLDIFSFSQLPLNDFGEIDLHRPYIDDVKFHCSQCQGKMSRVHDVLDCWFESGSMPYAQSHYPFKDAENWKKGFPADFIAEGLDQTRGWFYTLHVLANALYKKPAFKNCIVNGIVLAEDGQKMSKSKKNYPDPQLIFDKFGADALRLYLLSSPVVRADDLRFSEKGVEEIIRSVFLPLKNSYSFFATLANIDGWQPPQSSRLPNLTNKLDRWIICELGNTIRKITDKMDLYELDVAARELPEFIDKLTNFYIRRSRRRFWKQENDNDKNDAFLTLYHVLKTFCIILAPFSPFYSETVYRSLVGGQTNTSVHFCDWPQGDEYSDDPELREEISCLRTIFSLGHTIRAKKKLRVRQPLNLAQIALPPKFSTSIINDNQEVITEELNVKQIEILDDPEAIAIKIALPNARKLGPKIGKDVQKVITDAKQGKFLLLENDRLQVGDFILESGEFEFAYISKIGFDVESSSGIVVALDTKITESLQKEGIAREIIRTLQDMRKEADYQISDRINVGISGADNILNDYRQLVSTEVLAKDIVNDLPQADISNILQIEELEIKLSISK